MMPGERPSIALYTYSTLPRGSVVHTAALAEALGAAGCDVTVYALDKDGRGFYRPLAVPLRLIPAQPTPASTAELVRVRRAELASYVELHGLHHDVHHAEDCLTASALLDLRPRHGLRVARTIHHVEQFTDPYLAACQDRSIREADLCFVVSAETERAVAERYGVVTVRVSNGVALARWRPGTRQRRAALRAQLGLGKGPIVLAVGGVEARKNSVRLLAAFAKLHYDHPDAELHILGGASVLDHGATRAVFATLMDDLPLWTRTAVRERGVVPDAAVPAYFQAADVLALPSLQEGFGLCALEALASGLPVVAANRAPFTEYLDGSCATLVDPESITAIADGLVQALASPRAMRTAGRRRAKSHSWERVAALHLPGYQSLACTTPASLAPPHDGAS